MEGGKWRAGNGGAFHCRLSLVLMQQQEPQKFIYVSSSFAYRVLSGLVLARWQSELSIQGLWNRFGQHFFCGHPVFGTIIRLAVLKVARCDVAMMFPP